MAKVRSTFMIIETVILSTECRRAR